MSKRKKAGGDIPDVNNDREMVNNLLERQLQQPTMVNDVDINSRMYDELLKKTLDQDSEFVNKIIGDNIQNKSRITPSGKRGVPKYSEYQRKNLIPELGNPLIERHEIPPGKRNQLTPSDSDAYNVSQSIQANLDKPENIAPEYYEKEKGNEQLEALYAMTRKGKEAKLRDALKDLLKKTKGKRRIAMEDIKKVDGYKFNSRNLGRPGSTMENGIAQILNNRGSGYSNQVEHQYIDDLHRRNMIEEQSRINTSEYAPQSPEKLLGGMKMTSSLERHLDDDHVYYNISLYNTPDYMNATHSIKAEFNETRTIPILQNPSEYHMSVIRFSVPGSSIPIFLSDVQQDASGNYISSYSVTLSYLSYYAQVYVQYTPRGPINITPAEYPYYSYQAFLDDINTALQTAYTTLVSLAGSGFHSTTQAPFLIYNPTTQIISLMAEQAYATDVSGNFVGVYMNSRLFGFFQSFETIFKTQTTIPNGLNYQILVKSNGNNVIPADSAAFPELTTPYYQMSQEYQTLYAWNSFRSIQFITGSMPVKTELITIPYLQNNFSNSQQTNQSGTPVFSPILTDFEVATDGADIRTYIVYFPSAEYRLSDMQSTTPLYQFTLKINWIDTSGNTHPLYIRQTEVATAKFMFRKKSLVH